LIVQQPDGAEQAVISSEVLDGTEGIDGSDGSDGIDGT
jgi:hypothetical protein